MIELLRAANKLAMMVVLGMILFVGFFVVKFNVYEPVRHELDDAQQYICCFDLPWGLAFYQYIEDIDSVLLANSNKAVLVSLKIGAPISWDDKIGNKYAYRPPAKDTDGLYYTEKKVFPPTTYIVFPSQDYGAYQKLGVSGDSIVLQYSTGYGRGRVNTTASWKLPSGLTTSNKSNKKKIRFAVSGLSSGSLEFQDRIPNQKFSLETRLRKNDNFWLSYKAPVLIVARFDENSKTHQSIEIWNLDTRSLHKRISVFDHFVRAAFLSDDASKLFLANAEAVKVIQLSAVKPYPEMNEKSGGIQFARPTFKQWKEIKKDQCDHEFSISNSWMSAGTSIRDRCNRRAEDYFSMVQEEIDAYESEIVVTGVNAKSRNQQGKIKTEKRAGSSPIDTAKTEKKAPRGPIYDRKLVMDIQKGLFGLGLYKSKIDGLYGPGTSKALRSFQDSIGMPRSQIGYGSPTIMVLEKIRKKNLKLGLEKEARKAEKVEKAEQEMIQTWQLELEDVEVKGGRVNANR